MGKEIGIQIQEAQRVSKKTNPKRLTARHILKMSKEENIKSSKRKSAYI